MYELDNSMVKMEIHDFNALVARIEAKATEKYAEELRNLKKDIIKKIIIKIKAIAPRGVSPYYDRCQNLIKELEKK